MTTLRRCSPILRRHRAVGLYDPGLKRLQRALLRAIRARGGCVSGFDASGVGLAEATGRSAHACERALLILQRRGKVRVTQPSAFRRTIHLSEPREAASAGS